MKFSLGSCLSLVPTEIRKDKKHYILENLVSGQFFEMPEICIEAIHLINLGESLGDIEKLLSEKFPSEDVNLLDFADQLLQMQLITKIDGNEINGDKMREREGLDYLQFPSRTGIFFFNKLAMIVYFSLFVFDIFLFIYHPTLAPRFKDLFIFNIMALNIPIGMILSSVLVILHETGHVLAMRGKGLITKLGISHRTFFVVVETDMSSVWKLPSKERNVLYFAGICFDATVLFLSLVCQLTIINAPAIVVSILRFIVFNTVIRVIYQCCVYMKTDLYYVFENVSGCYNLMENAQKTLRNFLPFIKDAPDNEVIYNEEKRTVFLYSIFYFIGVGLSTSLLVFFYIPQLLYGIKKVLPGLLQSPSSVSFWDAVVSTLQILLILSLLLNSWGKKYFKG